MGTAGRIAEEDGADIVVVMKRLGDSREDFLRATWATVRAISRVSRARVGIENDALSAAYLSAPPDLLYADADRARLRGEADSLALCLRCHDAELHSAYRPRRDDARRVFDALERCRYEALGARRMAGIAANLSAVIAERHGGRALGRNTRPAESPLADVAAILAWEAFVGGEMKEPLQAITRHWTSRIDAAVRGRLGAMRATLGDQAAFARLARFLIADLCLEPADDLASLRRFADAEAENAAGEVKSDDESATTVKSPDLFRTAPQSSDAGQEDTDAGARGGGQPEELTEGGGEDPGGPLTERSRPAIGGHGHGSLRVAYSTEFDTVVFAEDLCEVEELRELRRTLDVACSRAWRSVGRLAARLQHAVMAYAPVGWETCVDDGLLDTGRLAAVVAEPINPVAYKLGKPEGYRDTIVTLLVDNSGSMKGEPITCAAVTADVVAQVLERCGVWVEVLGFTTGEWKGGRTFDQWRRDGMPPNPGRLNDLRHIIYKAAGAPWRRSRRNLGLMLSEDLLKENVDGEAVMWAHRRLMRRPETRRILVVISDGEPADNVTSKHNADDFLARHLRDVVAWIEARSPVEILAIGIGHEIHRFYRRAIVIEDEHALCEALLDRLTGLFEGRLPPAPQPEPPKAQETPSIILPELMMPENLERRRPRSSYFY